MYVLVTLVTHLISNILCSPFRGMSLIVFKPMKIGKSREIDLIPWERQALSPAHKTKSL